MKVFPSLGTVAQLLLTNASNFSIIKMKFKYFQLPKKQFILQQKVGTKIYSLTQCSLTVNECDWHILAGNNERINPHCLIRLRAHLRVLLVPMSIKKQVFLALDRYIELVSRRYPVLQEKETVLR